MNIVHRFFLVFTLLFLTSCSVLSRSTPVPTIDIRTLLPTPTFTSAPQAAPTASPSPASDLSSASPATLEERNLAVISPDNADQARLLASFRAGPQASVASLAFTSDHSRLVFTLSAQGRAGRPIYVWSIAGGAPVTILDTGSPLSPLVSLAADNSLLAAASGNTLQVWNTISWQRMANLTLSEAPVTALAFTPGNDLLLGVQDGNLLRYSPGAENPAWLEQAHSLEVNALAIDHRGLTAATAGMDGALGLWNPANGEDGLAFNDPPPAITHLAFSPDDLWLYSYAKDGLLRTWGTENPRRASEFQVCSSGLPGCAGPAFSPDRRLIALTDPAADDASGIRLWDVQARIHAVTLPTAPLEDAQITALAFSPDGRLLAIGAQDGTIQLWGIRGGAFTVGAGLQVTTDGDGANLRDRSSLVGSIRSQLHEGDQLTLLEGPQVAGGFNWWRAVTSDGREGWIVERPEWYE